MPDALREPIAFFIYAFTSVFVIVNPVSGILAFISLTGKMSEAERKSTARRAVVIACVLAVVFALAGELVLRIFGITADSLRVAGGILLLLIAMDMLQGKTSRESMTPEEEKDASKREDISVFPIATPLLTGPGAITTIILVMRTGKTAEMKVATFLAILLTFGLSYIIFRYAHEIHKMLGVTVSLVITRIMGLFLGAIAVNFVADGAWNMYRAYAG
ncbi:MAG: hypothetical protein AMK71_04810 [Nitrospira bacterium SG8_35_4]|nr:MAG: hypothetical protein AMK71_04810 [Nitrospira bacterium SG8_35_4]